MIELASLHSFGVLALGHGSTPTLSPLALHRSHPQPKCSGTIVLECDRKQASIHHSPTSKLTTDSSTTKTILTSVQCQLVYKSKTYMPSILGMSQERNTNSFCKIFFKKRNGEENPTILERASGLGTKQQLVQHASMHAAFWIEYITGSSSSQQSMPTWDLITTDNALLLLIKKE